MTSLVTLVLLTPNKRSFGTSLGATSRRLKTSRDFCPKGSRLLIAVKCGDAADLLYCPPIDVGRYSRQLKANASEGSKKAPKKPKKTPKKTPKKASKKMKKVSPEEYNQNSREGQPEVLREGQPEVLREGQPEVFLSPGGATAFDEWAAEATCQENEGFQEILSYSTGCYPEDVSFWNSFAPELGIQSANDLDRKVAGYPLPPLNVANSDFEDPDIGITEWSTVVYGCEAAVSQQFDDPRRCTGVNMCLAYNGTGYVTVSAGDSMEGETPPNSISRSDFRIPAVDTKLYQTAEKFCFSFAMRFVSREIDLPPSETGNNDFFTVEIQVGGDQGEMLFERTIRSTDVEGFGDATPFNGLGDDGGWELVEIELPPAPLGEPTFFTFRAMATNVGDYALDSGGYIDSLNIGPCKGSIVV